MSPPTRGFVSECPGRTYGTITFSGEAFIWKSSSILPMSFPATLFQFGLDPVRSPLLRVSLLLFFPPVTKMFQFAGFALFLSGSSWSYLIRGSSDHC